MKELMLSFIQNDVIHDINILKDYYNNLSSLIKHEKQIIIDKNNELQEKLRNKSEEEREQNHDRYHDAFYIIDMTGSIIR